MDAAMSIHGLSFAEASPGGRARALRLGGLLRLSRGRTGVAGAGSCVGALLRLRLAAVLPRRLSGALAVVGGVEAGALVMNRDRMEHARERTSAAHLAHVGRRLHHPVPHVEEVAVRTAVFVDRHRCGRLPACKTDPRRWTADRPGGPGRRRW